MGWLTTAGMSEGVSAALPPSLSIYRLAFFYNFSMRHNHITNSPPPKKKLTPHLLPKITCSQKTDEMRRATLSRGRPISLSSRTSVAHTPSSKSIVSTRARVCGHTMAGIWWCGFGGGGVLKVRVYISCVPGR